MTDIRGLGYLRVQTQDVPRWRELTVECLGMAEAPGPVEGGLYLRQDERQARYFRAFPAERMGELDSIAASRIAA